MEDKKMKIDKGGIINDFIEPNRNQYTIPVYQRNYEWSKEQCIKLFEDILAAHKKDKYHFTGSVVYAPLKTENKINHYVVIDGQQRLTTIYILIKALIDMAETEAEKDALYSSLFNTDKFNQYNLDEASKLKLKPVKSDNNQLLLLMNGEKSKWIKIVEFIEIILYSVILLLKLKKMILILKLVISMMVLSI